MRRRLAASLLLVTSAVAIVTFGRATRPVEIRGTAILETVLREEGDRIAHRL